MRVPADVSQWTATRIWGLGLALVALVPVPAPAQPPDLGRERTLAASVSEARMVQSVRRLVAFGPRMYGTPSNHAAAAWLADAFRDAGLEVTIRRDRPRDWYQPMSWQVGVTGAATGAGLKLTSAWPGLGAPAGSGEGPLSLERRPGAVCLFERIQSPELVAGCVAVLFDRRVTASGWPPAVRLRGAWTIPAFGISVSEGAAVRGRLAAGEALRVSFVLDAKTGTGEGATVVATLPGRDRSKHVLFCAHGDSDSGGPGANDNASGVAIVLEIARAAAAAVKAGTWSPAGDLRFAIWGGEITSTREYVAGTGPETSRLQAVFNFDQSGYGSGKDALYLEPDDVEANREIVTLLRAVAADHLGSAGFPARAASIRSQGGTDSYVFQDRRTPGAPVYPALTIYTSAWGSEREVPVTPGFPPLNWYPEPKPGIVTVDGDAFYHSAGDLPAHTTDAEPFNMGWCARVGLIGAVRLLAAR